MEWWAWVLIGIGVAVIGALKLTLFNKIMKNQKSKESLRMKTKTFCYGSIGLMKKGGLIDEKF